MPPKLGGARRTLERQMVDACSITRDVTGFSTDDVDIVTLQLVAGDTPAVIYAGKCLLADVPRARPPSIEGGAEVYRSGWILRIPFSAPALQVGDLVTITGQASGAGDVGKTFQVSAALTGSVAVSRVVQMIERDRGPRGIIR